MPRTAFVLSGGASLGAVQVGMLRALCESKITPDFLVGTSAGALNAAYLATRPLTVETTIELGEIWRGMRRHHAFPIQLATVLTGLVNRGDHLVPDGALRRLISRHIQLERVEEASVPLHLVCFDLLSGQEVRLSEGPAIDAVLAAATIPGVLPPVRLADWMLVDGGVINNTPISHAVELGAERIYVLPTGDPSARGLPMGPKGALNAAVHAFTLLVGARLQADLVRYADAAELVLLPAANPGGIQPTDFDHADSLIADSLRAARRVLANPRYSQPLAPVFQALAA